MATAWKYRINVGDLWEQYPNEISIQELAEKLANRLDKVKKEIDYIDRKTLSTVIIDLKEFSKQDNLNADDFDEILVELYDWADFMKTCWIDTMIENQKEYIRKNY